MKFAAIDIGSNAVRLLFSQVFENGKNLTFKKDALFRVPLRLGEDVFVNGKISKEKVSNLIDTMIAFKHLIKAYKPVDYRACATSAMREADNRKEILKVIKEKAGIKLEIIDGKKEADIIYSNQIAEKLDNKGNYLYIDVGGGSTELTLISKSRIISSQSFNIGTVRTLKKKDKKSEWSSLEKWLKENTGLYPEISGIGSGGNINKIFSMSGNKQGKPLSLKSIKKIFSELSNHSLEERITKLGLRPDRADVIIPAANIFISVMKWAGIKNLFVPQVGLSDGIIHVLYEKQKKQKSAV